MAATWTFLAVLLLGLGTYDLSTARRRRLRALVERAGTVFPDAPGTGQLLGWIKRQAERVPLIPGAGSLDELRQLLIWSGRPGGLGAEEFYFLQLVLALALALLLLGAHGWAGAAGGFFLGFWLPRA